MSPMVESGTSSDYFEFNNGSKMVEGTSEAGSAQKSPSSGSNFMFDSSRQSHMSGMSQSILTQSQRSRREAQRKDPNEEFFKMLTLAYQLNNQKQNKVLTVS